jgi:hypothetical protein
MLNHFEQLETEEMNRLSRNGTVDQTAAGKDR